MDKPRLFRQLYELADTHLNCTAQSTMKINLTVQVMSHIVAASLNILVATGKDDCTLCYELYSVMKQVANDNSESWISKLLSQNPAVIKQTL